MELAYQDLLPKDFHESSKVWIYQSNRIFTFSEALQIEDLLENFVTNWESHGTPVKGFGTLLFGQFIVFIADETATGISGCSTDSSVRIIKDLENLYKVNLFDRQNLAFYIKDKIQTIPLNQFNYAIENSFINTDTLYFNNTILTLEELKNKWIIPIKNSWLKSRVQSISN